jgi:DNA-3-methyladenine glycosylase II
MQLTIATSKPFSFDQTLRFMARFPPCQANYIVDKDSLTGAVAIDHKAVTFTLDRNLTLETTDRRALPKVASMIGANDDVEAFYAAAQGDKPMMRRIDQLHGLHHVRFLTIAEIAVYSVLMQRAPITIASSLLRRFREAFGLRAGSLYAMPELDALTDLTADQIATAIEHRGKAERIVEVVHGIRAIGEDLLRNAPYERARDALLAIRGIGPFSAAAILLRGLGRMDELPWLPAFAQGAREFYGHPVDQAVLTRRYGRLIGYWSFYMKAGVSVAA